MQDPHYVKAAFSRIADRYVLTNHVLSLGTDILWRKKVGKIVAGWQPETILDVATGTGDLALELQKRCPHALVTGS
ncbi:MAG: class I SAM-dependent methyltransferase, partial [Akkermansiaceae bacterium]